MNEPQRLLARLNPFSIDWTYSERVGGDILTAQDIAAALSGLDRGPYLLVLYLWADDATVYEELSRYLLRATIEMASDKRWRCKDDYHRLSVLVEMALHEIKSPRICKECSGTGVIINNQCPTCNGLGKKRFIYTRYFHELGIKKTNWLKCWNAKYCDIQSLILDWESIGMTNLLLKISFCDETDMFLAN